MVPASMMALDQSDAAQRSLGTIPMSARIKPSRKPPSQVTPPDDIKQDIEGHAFGNLRGSTSQNCRYYVVWNTQSGNRENALGWIRVYNNDLGQKVIGARSRSLFQAYPEGTTCTDQFLHRRCSRYRPVAWR